MPRKSLAEDKAYNYIKDQIMIGNLKPATKIIEQKIADTLDISRSPVRVAIKKLSDEGYLDVIPYRGAKVSSNKINKKDIIDRIEMLEMLIQQYIFIIESNNLSLDYKQINIKIDFIRDVIKKRTPHDKIKKSGMQLINLLLKEQPNKYIRNTIISIHNEIIDLETRIVNNNYKVYLKFLDGISVTIDYLEQKNFKQAKKATRIFINQLMLEFIDKKIDLIN